MISDSMISVKEAATMLGCDKQAIRQKLDQGEMRGEKRVEGEKEKWFVQREDVENEIAKQIVVPPPLKRRRKSAPAHVEDLYFGVDPAKADVPIEASIVTDEKNAGPSLVTVVQVMASEFARRLDAERMLNLRLHQELEDKEIQLRLLPDLKKRAENSQMLELEMVALRTQIGRMEEERVHILTALQRAEHDVIPRLQHRFEEEAKLHGFEISRLRERLHMLEQKRLQAEQYRHNIAELETALHEVMDIKEKERRASKDEIERLANEKEAEVERVKQEKETELAQLNEQLLQMKTQLEAAQQPWWRKWFS